jgi:hypothetical protein
MSCLGSGSFMLVINSCCHSATSTSGRQCFYFATLGRFKKIDRSITDGILNDGLFSAYTQYLNLVVI